MKQIYFLLIIVLSVTFSACKKEMGHDAYTAADFKGKWTINKQLLKQYRNDIKYRDTVLTAFNDNYIQFNTDGTGVFGDANGQVDFKWNILEDAITITKRINNEQTLFSPYKILKLTAGELVMLYDQTQTDYKNNTRYKDVSEEYYTK